MSEHDHGPEVPQEHIGPGEIPAEEGERQKAAAERFAELLGSIHQAREAIAAKAMGQARYERTMEKLGIKSEAMNHLSPDEFMTYHDTESDDHSQELDGELVSADPDIGRLERINLGLNDIQQACLGSYCLTENSSILEGPQEEYIDPFGEERVRYSEYRPSPDAIREYEHNFLNGEDHENRQKRIALEAQVGLNGLPVSPDAASLLVRMLELYHNELTELLDSPEEKVFEYLGMADAK